MKRRHFLGFAAWSVFSSPFVAAGQQSSSVRIAFLSSASPGPFASFVAAFREGLRQMGFVEGNGVELEFRWAEGNFDHLPALAAELLSRHPAVLLSSGGDITALAVKHVDQETPIVFISGGDPIRDGLVENLARPGGNVTGITFLATDLMSKKLGLLYDLVPDASTIALLINPRNSQSEWIIAEVEEAARAGPKKIYILKATSDDEIDAAFATASGLHVGAVLMGADALFNSRRSKIIELAAHYVLPVFYDNRESVIAGGLISYGPNIEAAYRRAGVYVGRILKGAAPTDLPVQQSTTFELVINLKTARSLGVKIPNTIFALADEIIE